MKSRFREKSRKVPINCVGPLHHPGLRINGVNSTWYHCSTTGKVYTLKGEGPYCHFCMIKITKAE